MAGRGPIGTFNILLRSPEMFDAMRGLGGGADSSISTKQRELAILLNGRFWTTQFEFLVHHRAATQAGLSEATSAAIIEGRRPAAMPADEEAVYNFLAELLNTRQVSDAAFNAAKEKLGEKGIVDMMGVVGFYQATSMFMNVDRYPMQSADQKPELKPLAKPLPYTAARSTDVPHPSAASSTTPALTLRGDRFKPLAYAEMTPAQKGLTDQLLSGKIQGSTNGPFNVLLRNPSLGEAVMRYGAYIRFDSKLPVRLNELAALITTRHWSAQFPWYAHHRAAAQAGLSEAAIAAIARNRRPAGLSPEEQEVYNFCTELWNTTQMSDATFNPVKARLGERGVVELIGVMGYYGIVSMLVNIDRYPMPDGIAAELN
jgi:4-carboxymuconolactone decarboxylase